MNPIKLPRNFKEVFKLSPLNWILYNGLISFFRFSGLWKYPIDASGDLETMTFMDKVYWLYKTIYPIKTARRGSGLQNFFKAHENSTWALPKDFQQLSDITISAVGDLLPHPYLANSATTLYNPVQDLVFGADVSMANLESVLYDQALGEFSFTPRSGPPLYYNFTTFDIVKGIGDKKYSFMATACNHSLDFGAEGVASTIQKLKAEKIQFNGMNEFEKDALKGTIIETKGFKLGVISHTFGLNAYQPPPDRPLIVNRTPLNNGIRNIRFEQIKNQLAYCKIEKSDFIIAQLHWGLEHEFFPFPDQVELAHHLAELGFDAIIGHHPHVIQPIEYYRTQRDPERIVPIFYSLGNLINPCSAPYLCLSCVAQITLTRGILKDNSTRTYVKKAIGTRVFQEVDETQKSLRLTLRPET